MKNVSVVKWDNGRYGRSGSASVRTVSDDFRPEDVTEDYDELEITKNGRVIYHKINGIVVYEEEEEDEEVTMGTIFEDTNDDVCTRTDPYDDIYMDTKR